MGYNDASAGPGWGAPSPQPHHRNRSSYPAVDYPTLTLKEPDSSPVNGDAAHKQNAENAANLVTRTVSLPNLKRDPSISLGPLNDPTSPSLGAPINLMAAPSHRDPAVEAAMTLTDCFLRRESSLEQLGLLNRDASLGAAKRPKSMGCEFVVKSAPDPPLAAPAPMAPPMDAPVVRRQSSLASLASIAELTCGKNDGNRTIFGDAVQNGAGAEQMLERNLSLVFQSGDSSRDLLAMQPEAPQPQDSSDDEDSDDAEEPEAKHKPFNPTQNSYEFFAQNTPQQVFGTTANGPEEGVDTFQASTFNDLAAVCLSQDRRQSAPPPNGVIPPKCELNTVVNQVWAPSMAPVVASPLNTHQAGFVEAPAGQRYIGRLTVEERRKRVARYLEKKKRRVWGRKVEYQCRKNLASKRQRIHGRFA